MSGNNRILWLSPADRIDAFPDIEQAMLEPDGLLAAGGDLTSERLLAAYQRGIFPWFEEGQPILWWSPSQRCVLRSGEFHVSRRLRRDLARETSEIAFNRDFGAVIRACAGPRDSQQGTWITSDMVDAYERLHREGWAHSIEVRDQGVLIGGMYGLAIGRVFFGESMFSLKSNASKYAFLALSQLQDGQAFDLVDCQVVSQHLTTLGASMMPRRDFASQLLRSCTPANPFLAWPSEALPVQSLAPAILDIALQ